MTAYAPRHAVTEPRTYRLSPWRRVRRVLLSLLPARTVTFTDEELYEAAVQAQAFADRFPCCEHCTDGAPCEPVNDHRVPCDDGCNDPAPRLLTEAELAALTPPLSQFERDLAAARARLAVKPVWAVRRDGLVTVTASGEVEVYPSPLACEPSTRTTAAMPAVSRQDHEELPAEFDDRPGPEVLQRVLDGLRAIPEQGDWGTMPEQQAAERERLASVMRP